MIDYFDRILNTINNSIKELDFDKFEELLNDVVRTLKDGNKVITTGLGKNVPICEKFVGTMLSFGLSATFLHTNTAVHGDLGVVRDGDLVIVLSKSGETAESICLINELKKRNIILWSITFKENSTVSRTTQKTLVVKMDNEGDEWDIVPNNSTTLYLILLQAIAIESGRKMGVTLNDFKRNHPGGHIGVQLNER